MQKIPTIFKRDYSHTYQVLPEINPVCQWVFDGIGQSYRKFQGMAVLIKNNIYYKRAILKVNQTRLASFIPCTYDHFSKKTFGWIPVDFNAPQDQYFKEAFNPSLPEGTYELIGPKILGNPEKFSEHKLISHTAWEVKINPRTYQTIKTFLSENNYEGIVFHHFNGKMAKIKRKDFGLTRNNNNN